MRKVSCLGFGIPKVPIPALTTAAGLLWAVFAATNPAHAGDAFRKLKGPQIRVAFSGMEFTDEVHWVDLYHGDGTISSASMGRKRTGRWRLDRDRLCVAWPDDAPRCYEVWISGHSVQLREPGHPLIEEGVLRKPAARN